MLEHGGNLIAAAKQYGIPLQNWLDLSTGINPNTYPIPPIPARAWQRLPEDDDGLPEAACQYYGCEALLPTAGSQAALQVLPKLRTPSRIAMPRTMYQEHAHAWRQHGHTITFFDADLESDKLDNTTLNSIDVLLLCNPNNPTGKRYTTTQLLKWHQQLQTKGGWLIVDEAFMDMTPEDSIANYSGLEGLFVLRSLGKFFGLAGARVGFLLAMPHYLKQAQEMLGPWTLTGPSREVAKQALLDTAWQEETRKQLTMDSNKLKQYLTESGLTPTGGTALFQYVKSEQVIELHEFFAENGIWVRLFKSDLALRFGLPPNSEWKAFADTLKRLV
jgi:cobalamin biosynthesis protein CobC